MLAMHAKAGGVQGVGDDGMQVEFIQHINAGNGLLQIALLARAAKTGFNGVGDVGNVHECNLTAEDAESAEKSGGTTDGHGWTRIEDCGQRPAIRSRRRALIDWRNESIDRFACACGSATGNTGTLARRIVRPNFHTLMQL